MHDVQVQIRCQRCGNQMELKDPGPDDPWPPQQFWECPECGRHFWTTYPPPKKPKPAPPPKAAAPEAAPGSETPPPKPPPVTKTSGTGDVSPPASATPAKPE